jgi:hypothetical protein
MLQRLLEAGECERSPDEAFKQAFLLPLQACSPPTQNLFILVDSIDESYLQAALSERATGSRTIAELLAAHHSLFPQWLLLACSSRYGPFIVFLSCLVLSGYVA